MYGVYFSQGLQLHFSGVVGSLVKTIFIRSLHLRLVVKELIKSVGIWRSYGRGYSGSFIDSLQLLNGHVFLSHHLVLSIAEMESSRTVRDFEEALALALTLTLKATGLGLGVLASTPVTHL